MHVLPVSLANLATLNEGEVGDQFDQAMREVAADLAEHPNRTGARSITVTLSFSPLKNSSRYAMTAKVGCKLPSATSEPQAITVFETDGGYEARFQAPVDQPDMFEGGKGGAAA